MKRLLIPLVAALVLVAGCGPGARAAAPVASPAVDQTPLSQLQVAGDLRALTGPATAVLADRAIAPIDSGPVSELPVTVTSHHRSGDREVTVTDTTRIVAFDLAGSIAATVWGLGLGDRLVARDVSTEFPGSEKLPLVTTEGHSINAEAVLAQRPTVILTDGTLGPRDVVEQLADTGVPVVFVKNTAGYVGAADLAREVAAALGVAEAGERLAERITADVAAVKAEIARLTPVDASARLRMVFLYVRGSSGVYYLFGEGSGATELIDSLGGIDVAAELGWPELQPLTDEAMVAAKPDVILLMTHGLASAGGVDGLLEQKPAIALTPAGERRRFVDMADGDVLSFGPRSASVLEALARAVYAPRSNP